MQTSKLIVLLGIVAFFSSCSSISKTEPTLKQECKQSGNKDSMQCDIYHNDMSWPQHYREYQMGFLYQFGFNDIAKDCNKAKYWFEKSAEHNNANAFNGLGMLYNFGCGVSKNYKKAEEYYLLAIEGGEIQSKANLAALYLEGGYGIEQDYDKAATWFKNSIKDTPDRAYDGLSLVYINQKKYEEALPYLIKGAELGWANSQNNLGYLYDEGLAVEQDKQKALYWYRKAAEQQDARAQRNLAHLILELNGFELSDKAKVDSYEDKPPI